jgi:hypothetical protein
MRHWALLANPNRYRIDAAIRAGIDDWWTTKGKDLRKGDEALIWKAKGRDASRGIVALGEVLCSPECRSDSANPYWTGRENAAELRVKVRYTVPPGLPLWLRLATCSRAVRRSLSRVESCGNHCHCFSADSHSACPGSPEMSGSAKATTSETTWLNAAGKWFPSMPRRFRKA